MQTDRPPRKAALLAKYRDSDQLISLQLPGDNSFQDLARAIELSMKEGVPADARQSSTRFLEAAADFYQVRRPQVRALAARPLRVRESGWSTELFGDYTLGSAIIRIWTRTAVRKQITSFGTFFSTLCHEFCHHLDCERFGFSQTPHTRGFYQRTAILYHHARSTPMKRLAWIRMAGGRWKIDWQRTKAMEGNIPGDGRKLEASGADNGRGNNPDMSR